LAVSYHKSDAASSPEKKNTVHAVQAKNFVGVKRRQNESGVLRGGTFFLRYIPSESGGYHGENYHFFGRIWNKGYHGSVGASIWFCKFYCGKAAIVGLIQQKPKVYAEKFCTQIGKSSYLCYT
jgi:hypothetical protein